MKTLILGFSNVRWVDVEEPPPPAPCPPWCIGSAECGAHREERHHEARGVSVALGEPDVTALVVACRDDEDPDMGVPYVWCSGDGPVTERVKHDWAASLPPNVAVELGRALCLITSPDAALQLGQALVAAGMEAADLTRQAVTL